MNMTNPAFGQRFSVHCSNFIRVIRLRETKLNLWNDHQLSISSFEIFSLLFYNIVLSTSPHPIDLGQIRRFFTQLKANEAIELVVKYALVQIPVK
jgi:hypothetical protein